MLEVKDLFFSYGKRLIFRDLSFMLKKGTINALIGPSGVGKTTLFKLLTGMLVPGKGTITYSHDSFLEGAATYMMQEDLLLPWRSVLDNIILTMELGKKPKEGSKNHALKLLEELGLKGCEEMYPDALSGGMRQRVSLARALFQNRPLLFLDEPFGSLDVSMREHLYSLLQSMHKKHGTTILMITHDFRDALSLADEIFLLAHHHIEKKWEISEHMRKNPYQSHRLLEEMRHEMCLIHPR